jgi:hypothetical protein
MKQSELTLAAEDAEDLEIVSARLQDAVAHLKDFAWLPKKRRFVALFNRFKWEEKGKRTDLRVRALLHFDDVLSVKSKGLKRGAPEAVVSLLAVSFAPRAADDPAGTVELLFASGGTIRLEVECLSAGLTDVSGDWAARGRPDHDER